MKNASELAQENEALRERLSLLSEASLRINESLRSRLPAIMDLRKPPSQGSLPAPCTGGRVPGLCRCEGRHPPSPSVSDPAGPAPVGTLASPVRWYVLASLVAFYWPGPLTVITNSSDSILPSLAQMVPRRHSP